MYTMFTRIFSKISPQTLTQTPKIAKKKNKFFVVRKFE